MFSSPYPDVVIPETSIYEDIFGTLDDADLARIALIDSTTGQTVTYGQLKERVDAFAGALAARGIGVGSVVALHCPNSPAFAVAFHGILRTGATVTTTNVLYTAEEIAKQVADAGAVMLVTVSALMPNAGPAAQQHGLDAARIVVLDGAEGHPDLKTLLAENAPAPEVSFDPAEHLAVLPYSSGTTGVPKGVMLSHRNLVANVAQAGVPLDLAHDDRVLAVLPFFHIYGMTVLLNIALRLRATLITMPRFDLTGFLEAVQRHRCTVVFVAPPIVVALAKHPLVAEYDISSVRVFFSGAAPLDGDVATVAAQRAGARVLQGYGMTELSPVSQASPLRGPEVPVSSVGYTLPNMVAKLVDPVTGASIPAPAPGERTPPGELLLKGPNVMKGYFNRPDATAETIDAEGFLRTGDLAVIDSDGVVTIVDRVKELIKYKGYQVAPAELEALLLSHPQIVDAAVIGVTDAEGEEIPKAFVVRAPDAALSAEEVMGFVAERVAPYKKVREVEFIEQVPKSASGKILRKDLRARG